MSFKDSRKGSTLCVVEVVRTQQLSPSFRRITVRGEQLEPLPVHGYDQWFRLFLPQEEGETSFDLPTRVDMLGYLKYLRMPGAVRPPMRNYTVRELRPGQLELDIDFVVHGDEGLASRWASNTGPGDRIALIDQGRGFEPSDSADHHLLVADETGLPAVAAILRDLRRDARGTAIIEIPHADDAQDTAAPAGFDLQWVVRRSGERPGEAALAAAKDLTIPEGELNAYVVGEQALPTSLRRHLVAQGVPKKAIQFVGYWRLDKNHQPATAGLDSSAAPSSR